MFLIIIIIFSLYYQKKPKKYVDHQHYWRMPKEISIKNTLTLSIPKEGEISFKKESPVSEKQTPKEVGKIRTIEVEPTSFKPIKTLVHNHLQLKKNQQRKKSKKKNKFQKIQLKN